MSLNNLAFMWDTNKLRETAWHFIEVHDILKMDINNAPHYMQQLTGLLITNMLMNVAQPHKKIKMPTRITTT
jgi:hypothetical protein